MKIISTLVKAVYNLNNWVGKAVAFLVLPIVAVSMYEVIARYVFNAPTTWAGQILSILFVAMVVLGGGYVLLEDGHVRMDAFYARWSLRRRTKMDLVTAIFFLLFAGILAWTTSEMAWQSILLNERSWSAFKGPIYPKKIALALGVILLLLQGIAQLVEKIRILRQGKDKISDGR